MFKPFEGAPHLDASVVICAYTEARWDDLRAAVASVQRQSVLPREIIVVVDHNSALLQHAQKDLPGVVVLENQETRGLSGARNTGVRAAQGSLVAFLDDDAVADPRWLPLLAEACAHEDVLGCGGIVEPAWQTGKPSWFPEEFTWVVGCSYLGLPVTRSPVRNLIGASMCIRREVFDAVGGFRSEIGRIGKHPVGCEETELCLRAQRYWPTRTFLHEPASSIRHLVPGSRATWRYFRERCFYEGRSKALVTQLAGATNGLASERSYTFSTLPRGVARNIMHGFAHRNRDEIICAAAIVAGLAITTSGYITGVLSQAPSRCKAWMRQHAMAHLRPAFATSGQLPIVTAAVHREEGDLQG